MASTSTQRLRVDAPRIQANSIRPWVFSPGSCTVEVGEPGAEAERTAAIEHNGTPDWLRRRVLARDDHHRQVCGKSGNMPVHHIVFRSRDGPAPEVEFRNRTGDLLVSRDAVAAAKMSETSAIPRAVLRLLREDGGAGSVGGFVQPPPLRWPAAVRAS